MRHHQRSRFGVVAVALLITAATLQAATTVDFDAAGDDVIFDSAQEPCAKLFGAAQISAEAKRGTGALDLRGAEAKGVVDFGDAFALSKEGTVEFWCMPRKLAGVVIGKYGAMNAEFVQDEQCFRFGLKLMEGEKGAWIHCQSPPRSVKANQWVKIKASWGKYGLALFLNDDLVARAVLPASFNWFSEKGRFVLGSYTWPGGYDVWFFDGLIDAFSFRPTQEQPPASLPEVPESTAPDLAKLLLKQTPKPNYGVAVPSEVSGRVATNALGLAGVSVTDGFSVVKTDAQGFYAIKPDARAMFIYITRPSGYDVVGDWYKPVDAKVDFSLDRAVDDESDYTFVHVTDTHISALRRSVEGLNQFVQEVNDLAPKVRFVINSGDLVNLHKALENTPATGHEWFRNYTGTMNHLAMPYYNVAGDHTDSSYRLNEFPRGDIRAGKPLYWEYLGPNLFSFEYGKIHFVSVDYGYHLGQRQIKGIEYPTHQVQPIHVAWMKQDMAHRTADCFVVTTSEHDLVRHCPGFIEMARLNDVRLQLTGDDHIVSHKTRFVPYRGGGALSGCWWSPKTDLCPDLSPRGYIIYHVRGEQMDFFYKGLGQRVAIVSHRVGAPWQGRVTFRAHVVQPKANETLQYTLDGKNWQTMREVGRPFYRAVFEAELDSTLLTDGLITIKVRSSLTDEIRSREFVVSNNNQPTDYQADATLEFSVGQLNPPRQKAPTGKVDVVFNGEVVGVLSPNARKKYSLRIPAANLYTANTLRFRFANADDGMSLSSPILTFAGESLRDPRDVALRQVREAWWGAKSVDWGGFLAGDGDLDEDPFCRKQNVFCFVLNDTKATMKSNDESVTIWKELEELLPASGWMANAYRPTESEKKKFWTGKGAVLSGGQVDRPLDWRFDLKNELTDDGLNTKTRTYAIWIHQYGYKDRQLTIALDGKPVGTIASRNTETFNDRGEYVAAGHYIWQNVGQVVLAGGSHKLTLQPGKDQHLLLNAVVLTTDLALVPQYHELKDAATKDFTTDAPTVWSAYIETPVDVFGLVPNYTSMSWFDLNHTGSGQIFDKNASAIITLPQGVDLITASQRLVGVNWAYPKKPFENWKRLTIKQESIQRDSKPFTQYTIGLSYLPPRGSHDLLLYLRTTLEPGAEAQGYQQLQWDGGQSPERQVAFKVASIPKTNGFHSIVVGAAGGSWEFVHPLKWPDFPDLISHCGLNAVTLWGICGKPRPDMDLRQKTIQHFLSKGVQTLDNFSPWISSVLPPKTIADGAAADIDGNLYKDYKGRTIPCPTYIEGNPHIAKQLEHLRVIAGFGITGLILDDERFNNMGPDICFCPRCKDGYQAYLKQHFPGLVPMALPDIVRQNEKYAGHYDAWLKFRAQGSSRRLARLRQAFVEAATESDHSSTFASPFVAPLIHAGDGILRNARESHLVDFPSLAEGVDYVCPMIYITQIKHVPSLITRLRSIRNNMNGQGNLWVTLNCGYKGAAITLDQKPVIQYSILEALMNGCKGINFWNGYAAHDPLSLEQIAAAIRMTSPYEDLLLQGDVVPDFADCPDSDVNLSAIADGNHALLLVSNYAAQPNRVTVKIAGDAPRKVIDVRTGKVIAQLSKDNRSFDVSFGDLRAHLFQMQQ